MVLNTDKRLGFMWLNFDLKKLIMIFVKSFLYFNNLDKLRNIAEKIY